MKSVTLAAFNSRTEAEPVRQFLCDNGIWAEIRSDAAGEVDPAFDRPAGGIRLEVPREDFEAALQLIYDWNAQDRAEADRPPMPWLGRVVDGGLRRRPGTGQE